MRGESALMRMKRLVAALGIAAALTATPVWAAGSRQTATPVAFHDLAGLHVTSVKQVSPRLLAIVVTTKALPRPANIYVLLPPGYSTNTHQHYPVLYLLHGTNGTASDWTVKGGAQRIIGNRNLITVMPDIALDDGGGGWCTDWPNGAQLWETFHIQQLIPWVDGNLRTIATRPERAIAGLSQGGYCAAAYGARHPDLFAQVLSYSGVPDMYYDTRDRVGVMAVINVVEVAWAGQSPDTFFGDPVSNGINWAAHDPATLAENLRWTHLSMYWGNGQPGPYDDPSSYDAGGLEAPIGYDNADFQARLEALHIAAQFHPYGPGTHSWPYWDRDLAQSIDGIMFGFAHPAADPSSFTYTSADDAYGVYGWQVKASRTAREFSTLTTSGDRQFMLSGSGSMNVVTPPTFKAGHRYELRFSGDAAASRTLSVIAGADRRLRITVPLGPSNPYQQETPQAVAAGTNVYTTSVTVS